MKDFLSNTAETSVGFNYNYFFFLVHSHLKKKNIHFLRSVVCLSVSLYGYQQTNFEQIPTEDIEDGFKIVIRDLKKESAKFEVAPKLQEALKYRFIIDFNRIL